MSTDKVIDQFFKDFVECLWTITILPAVDGCLNDLSFGETKFSFDWIDQTNDLSS